MRAFLLALFVLGCSEGTRVNVTKTVGTMGGTVNASTGTAVQIPAGALSAQAMITIQSLAAPAPSGTVLVGQAYDFGPQGASFSSPVTITLPIDPAKFPSGRSSADVRIYTAPRGSTEYAVLPTNVSGNLATSQTTHFTVFLPAVPAANVVLDMRGGGDMAENLPSQDLSMMVAQSDMAQAGDMARGTCTPVCTSDVEGCYCEATCSGVLYKISCFPPTGGSASCICTANGSSINSPSIPGCNGTNEKAALTNMCIPPLP
jgi:hypothetical protein